MGVPRFSAKSIDRRESVAAMRARARLVLVALAVMALALTGVVPAYAAGGVLRGQVTLGDSATPAGAGEVRVTIRGTGAFPQLVSTDANGNWSITVTPGEYRLFFEYRGPGNFANRQWPNASPAADEVPLLVPAEGATADITLPVGAVISGQIMRADGTPIFGVDVSALLTQSPSSLIEFNTLADDDGSYSIRGLSEGEYHVFSFVTNQGQAWWGGSPLNQTGRGDAINLALGEQRGDIDIVIDVMTRVNVVPTCRSCMSEDFISSTDWQFLVETLDPTSGKWATVRSTSMTGAGGFSTNYPGKYRFSLATDWPGGWGSGRRVVDLAGGVQTVRVPISEPPVTRVGGADRFAVSASISADFPVGSPVAYVVNGLSFADALSAGPAAAHEGGPLLLVTPRAIPDAVRDELVRLKPGRIVVVGGTASVGTSVFNELAKFAPVTDRIGGADRFEVSLKLSKYAFPQGADTVILATGLDFPDALSAGGAAASVDSPVITVNGRASAIDGRTARELARLDVSRVWIAGGPMSMSDGILSSIQALSLPVERLSGADRYRASVAINREFFDAVPTVYLAVGTGYADALGGGALAGKDGSALIVVPSDCVPSSVIFFIQRTGAQKVVLLGGPASLGPGVARLSQCGYP